VVAAPLGPRRPAPLRRARQAWQARQARRHRQQGHQLARRRRIAAAALHQVDHAAQAVVHPHQQRHEARRRQRSRARSVQDLLCRVAELGEGAQPHHAPRTLERVQLAAGLDRRLGIVGQARQAERQLVEALARLLDEQRHQVRELVFHGRQRRHDGPALRFL